MEQKPTMHKISACLCYNSAWPVTNCTGCCGCEANRYVEEGWYLWGRLAADQLTIHPVFTIRTDINAYYLQFTHIACYCSDWSKSRHFNGAAAKCSIHCDKDIVPTLMIARVYHQMVADQGCSLTVLMGIIIRAFGVHLPKAERGNIVVKKRNLCW